jgi:hypothetical protein
MGNTYDSAEGWGLLKDRSYRVDGIVPQIKRTRSDLQPKAVKIRYGPYFVPNITTSNERGEFGMLVDWPDEHIEKYLIASKHENCR